MLVVDISTSEDGLVRKGKIRVARRKTDDKGKVTEIKCSEMWRSVHKFVLLVTSSHGPDGKQ